MALNRIDRLRDRWWRLVEVLESLAAWPPVALLLGAVTWLGGQAWAGIVDFLQRLVVAAKVLLPVVVGLVLLWHSLPWLDALGLGLSAIEVKGYGRGLVKCVLYFWVAIALSSWLDARGGISLREAWRNPRSLTWGQWLYLAVRFPAILGFVSTIGGL